MGTLSKLNRLNSEAAIILVGIASGSVEFPGSPVRGWRSAHRPQEHLITDSADTQFQAEDCFYQVES